MSGRRPAEAVDNYVDPIQRALSCVTDGVVSLLTDGRKPGGTRGLILNRNNLVPLQGPQKLHLHISQRYEIVEAEGERGPWKVSTRGYTYHVVTDDRAEVILFHWHPDGPSQVRQPHMHLGRAILNPQGVLTRKAHVPTGRIAIEEVLQLLISDFQVVPRRADWQEVLSQSRERFVRYRTWS